MQNDQEAQSLIDNALVEQEFMSLVPGVIKAVNHMQNYSNSSVCDSVFLLSGDTSDFIPAPQYRVNFTNKDCSGFMPDHKSREGYIIITVKGKLNVSGTELVVRQYNYVAAGLTYTSDSIQIKIQSANVSQMQLNTVVINGTCSNNVFHIRYSADKKIRLMKSNASADHYSEALISGEAAGINRFGLHYQNHSDTLNGVFMNEQCSYFARGVENIRNEGKSTLTASYGDGTCDELATYNIFQNTVEFKLK